MIVSAVVWFVGILGGAVVEVLGGIRAERLGEIGFTVGMAGEVCAYGFGWLRKRISQKERDQIRGFPGPKRYGNKKDVV